MILEKFGEYVYDQASLFLTRWRVGCFLISCLILSGVLFDILSTSFWVSGVSSAVETLAKVMDIPLYMFLLVMVLAFLVAPFINKRISLFVMGYEVERAQPFMMEIESKVSQVDRGFLPEYRDRAVKGERYIQNIRGLCEALVFFSVLGMLMHWYSGIMLYYYSILFTVPVLIFFAVQSLFAVYLRDIYFYKKLAEYYSAR